jgi:dihydroxyacid dehydratase/phosphogluconate dehydratase
MRSDLIKKGLERTPHRALIKSTGVPDSELAKPFIGVATSFTDLIPGHVGMRDMERFINCRVGPSVLSGNNSAAIPGRQRGHSR